jgi:hypothetical protein
VFSWGEGEKSSRRFELASIGKRKFRGHDVWWIRGPKGEYLEYIGVNPSPERVREVVRRHGIDVARYSEAADRVGALDEIPDDDRGEIEGLEAAGE